MKIEIDPDVCEGHGKCVEVAPELFHLPDDIDLAEAIKPSISDENEIAAAKAAVAECPRAAIKLIEE